MIDSILEGNEKLVFKIEGTNIVDKFGTPVSKKFKAMERKDWSYTERSNSDMWTKWNFLKGDRYTPFALEIANESVTLNLRYKLIDDSDSEWGNLILTFTTRSLFEDKYKEIPLNNGVVGIKLIEKIINKTYDLFVRDTITGVLVKEIEKLIQ